MSACLRQAQSVGSFWLVSCNQNKPDRPNKQDRLAVGFSILLEGVPHDVLIQDDHSKMDGT